MLAQLIDRRQLKAQMKEMLRCAQVSPRGMTCLYLALTLVLNLADSFLSALGTGLLGTFVSILTGLMGMVLTCGYVLYCMAIRRGDYKLLVNADGTRLELYDMRKDPNETTNIADRHPRLCRELSDRVIGWYFTKRKVRE